jgi:hypothetical protein
MSELRRAIIAVWLILSAAGVLIAASPFLVPAPAFDNVLPTCPARVRGGDCPACGLTTGFVAIADGRWDDAARANAAAPLLFALFTANAAAAALVSFCKLLKRGQRCKP